MRLRPAFVFTLVAVTVATALSGCKSDGAAGGDPNDPGAVMAANGKIGCAASEVPVSCPTPGATTPTVIPTGGQGSMIAIGDSYSAGEGSPQWVFRPSGSDPAKAHWVVERDYLPGTDVPTNRCHQSANAYPVRVAAEEDLTLDFRACSGAVTNDYWSPKIDPARLDASGNPIAAQRTAGFANPNLKLVTVGFGGNNAKFAAIVKGCMLRENLAMPMINMGPSGEAGGVCADYVRDQSAKIAERLGMLNNPGPGEGSGLHPDSVVSTYRDIRQNTPASARVIAVSYPKLFPAAPTGNCNLGTGFPTVTKGDQIALNDLVSNLNYQLRAAANEAAIDFVDMTDAYVTPREDHGMCVDQGPDDTLPGDPPTRWITRFHGDSIVKSLPAAIANLAMGKPGKGLNKTDTNESVHPNNLGQKSYADHVLACYRDQTQCSNHDDFSLAQWREVTYQAAGCPPRSDYDVNFKVYDNSTVTVARHDFTGDGTDETYVTYECPALTSSPQTGVIVFDTHTIQHPVPIGHLGQEQPILGAEVSAQGPALILQGRTFEGEAIADAHHHAVLVYTWNGHDFEVQRTVTVDGAQPGDLADGTHYGYLTDFDDTTITEDSVEYLEGKQARAACIEDGQDIGDTAWCADYYIRDTNDLLRTFPLADTASLTYFSERGKTTTTPAGDRTALGEALRENYLLAAPESDGNALFAFVVKGGQITSLTQTYVN